MFDKHAVSDEEGVPLCMRGDSRGNKRVGSQCGLPFEGEPKVII